MNLFDQIKRITRQHCELMGYPVADCLKDAPDLGFEIPASIRKRKCSWCDRQAEPDHDLCYRCNNLHYTPQPWKE